MTGAKMCGVTQNCPTLNVLRFASSANWRTVGLAPRTAQGLQDG